ncbi:hypothetical protein SAMN04487970_10823 [Paenibacillus tianmuensis]|uniref:Uncharacterized protein n=1 Tax=Paenibacillus tianmuensis TaxID=624147 RepID=A0A1G4U1K9_9BACL|nr:hypothetical protein SAMN04487970_10823 [Paenibacillus tianmuensis]
MGRGRKSSYVKTITTKDHNMLHVFRCVGYLTEHHLKAELGQREKRIQAYLRDGYIERCSVYNRSSHQINEVYRLTTKGKELGRNQLALDIFIVVTQLIMI